MKTTTTYGYRVQRWHIPVKSPWMPQKWTLTSSWLSTTPPHPGHGVPDIDYVVRGDRMTWCWDDSSGTPRKVVCIRLKRPITKTHEEEAIAI